VKYNFAKIAPTEAEQRQIKRTRTKENVIIVDELVLSQQDQPQIYRSIHQIAQAGVIRIILRRSWFQVPESKSMKPNLILLPQLLPVIHKSLVVHIAARLC